MTRILALDGGGSRGIIPATILDLIYKETRKYPLEFFDVIAGTSTGGIIALSLAMEIPTSQIVDVYLKKSKDIFEDTKLDDVRDVGNVFGAQYGNKNLKEIVDDFFQNNTLGDINSKFNGKKKFMVPTFNLNPKTRDGINLNFRPEVYNSFYIKYSSEKLVDIAMRTSAGPTYFPIYESFIDGGVAINNPALSALSFVVSKNEDLDKKHYCYSNPAKKGLGQNIDDIKIMSIGTGTANGNYIQPEEIISGDWGVWQWRNHIGNLLTESNMQATHYYLLQLLSEDQYHRIQFDFTSTEAPYTIKQKIENNKSISMDTKDPAELHAMMEFATRYFQDNKSEILDWL
jgi:patatin-like phospholipase/acyl hydrolase